MTLNDALDRMVREKQEECDHSYQDRMETPNGVFCGRCWKKEEEK